MELYEVRQEGNDYSLLVLEGDKEYHFSLKFGWRGIILSDDRSVDWYEGELPQGAKEVFTEATLSYEGEEVAEGNLVVFQHERTGKVILQVHNGRIRQKDVYFTNTHLLKSVL